MTPADPAWARTALSLVERRAVAGLDPDTDMAVLDGRPPGRSPLPGQYAENWINLRRALLEVAEIRSALAQAAAEHPG